MRHAVLITLALALLGCATTPATGSKRWYDERLLEIETAYANEEISKAEYLSLKTEADSVRVQYQHKVQDRLRYDGTPTFPRHSVFLHHHHHRR